MRVHSLDIVRGLVMVLMVIDHVRVYSGQPAGGPSAGIFFTRWITHFCAPAFAFLAGTSAFLYAQKAPERVARFLFTRGLILVVLELTLIKFFWTFRLDYSFNLAGVIWMLGWCMVLLAGLVKLLRPKAIGWLGIAIIAFQQVFGLVPKSLPANIGRLWEFIYPANVPEIPGIAILYVLVPWIGVMAAGYGFGLLLLREPAGRKRILLRLGLAFTALFLVIGAATTASAPPSETPFLFQLLNQRKYPASQLFLLMTLGPTILLLGLLDSAQGRVVDILSVFGRVPMFFYLLHIPFIHISAHVITWLREGSLHPERYATAPFTRFPKELMWSLPLLYLTFAAVVVMLYLPCAWFDKQKRTAKRNWLLSYI